MQVKQRESAGRQTNFKFTAKLRLSQMGSNLSLIKLGGSVVTYKDKPLQANHKAIDSIAKVLSGVIDGGTPSIIVHGGGSFGHYWSVKYDMHTKPSKYDLRGVAVVHESMIALNQIVVNSMLRHGANPYGILPSLFMNGLKPSPNKVKELQALAGQKIAPVTFGDVVHIKNHDFSILSGDAIMTFLARILRPSRVIFATNVDGIYRSLESKEIITEIVAGSDTKGKNNAERKPLFSHNEETDVTGGMKRKVTEAFRIASFGIDVVMVNGLKPERIRDAIEGKSITGTLIKGRRGKKN